MEFDIFATRLLEEAKAFYEKARNTTEKDSKDAYLHSSLLLTMSFLEASINSIIEELMTPPYDEKYSLLERSLLLEREIQFENGEYTISRRLKISRLVEKIEFLVYKYSGKKIDNSSIWYMHLKESIDLRNKLVHPRECVELTETQVERAILSVLNAINELYKIIYNKKLPKFDFGTISRLDLK